ncbi:hypothetical protein X566_20185 [Afipia sp. P52-10]|uniref:phage tail protein n=1 Tax=Afipia sp. P52-10 TaxID=1429916 RepID=UPI0003DF1E1E|nr:phage tail protein [Afipia sp. P52-10]ETR75917.1 hypothetical protein X566_20185 [Afipia sp. P52-10]
MAFLAPAIGGLFGLGSIGSSLVNLGLGLGASFLVNSLRGNQQQQAGTTTTSTRGTQVNVQYGGAIPRSCIFGMGATAGHLLYANVYGENNDYLQRVFAIGDGPHHSLDSIFVNGKKCTFGAPDAIGTPVTEFDDAGEHNLWVRFFQGFEGQAADAQLYANANPSDRWTADDRLAGICYVSVTERYNERVMTSLQPYLFVVKGRLVYDPRKDSSIGGFGPHRWTDPATWEWSDNPAVCRYNFQRGLFIGGELIVGQGIAPSDLILDRYATAMNVCDELVDLKGGGSEPRYRIGMTVGADREYSSVLQDFDDAMAGQALEAVGAFAPVAGAARPVVLTFTDDDLVEKKPLRFTAKRSRADLVNSIFGSYTDPMQSFQQIPYAPRISGADEIIDGERLATQRDFAQILSETQAQRVAEIFRRRVRKQATAEVTLRPRFIVLEPGDWVTWNSARYGTRTWQVESRTRNDDRSIGVALGEIGADVFAWDETSDELDPNVPGDLPGFNELSSSVAGFTLQAIQVNGEGGLTMPSLRCLWSPISDPTIVAVIVEYRIKTPDDSGAIKTVRFLRPDAGEDTILGDIQAGTEYEARATIETIPARQTFFTVWVSQTASPFHVVPVSKKTLLAELAALEGSIQKQVTEVMAALKDEIGEIRARLPGLANEIARNWIDKRQVRSQLSARFNVAYAGIEEVRTVAVDTQEAFAEFSTEVTASFGSVNALIATNTSAIATLNGYAAARWSVTTNVNGYIAGIELINGGQQVSSFTVLANVFRVSQPGTTGGSTVDVFTIASVGGSPKIVWRADMIGDGSITVNKLSVGFLSAISANIGEITAGVIRSADNKFRIDLDNRQLVISD